MKALNEKCFLELESYSVLPPREFSMAQSTVLKIMDKNDPDCEVNLGVSDQVGGSILAAAICAIHSYSLLHRSHSNPFASPLSFLYDVIHFAITITITVCFFPRHIHLIFMFVACCNSSALFSISISLRILPLITLNHQQGQV